jgi:hypothetical protein
VAPVITMAEEHRPEGFALMLSGDRVRGRAYVCDPVNHCIDVVDAQARPLFSFGGFGPRRGQFNAPADVAIVSTDPGDPSLTEDSAVLAVADRGNHRVQFFELDGASLSSIEGPVSPRPRTGWPARSGWPFFRLATIPRLVLPSRLEWRPPFLDVTTVGGAIVRLNMLSALLPGFNEWLGRASSTVLRHALDHFLQEPYRDEIPMSYLQRIAERLKPSETDLRRGWPV